ncbi:33190_t:CDS:2, partial [Racocetra persica]
NNLFKSKILFFQPHSYHQFTSFTSPNIKINCINFESDKHLDNEFNDQSDYRFEEQIELYKDISNISLYNFVLKKQLVNTIDEAYAAVEAFTYSNRFEIRK